jgi:hypothetical protein
MALARGRGCSRADRAAVRAAIVPRSAPRLTFGNRVVPATNVMEGSMSGKISGDTSARQDAPRPGRKGGVIVVVAVVLALVLLIAFNMN